MNADVRIHIILSYSSRIRFIRGLLSLPLVNPTIRASSEFNPWPRMPFGRLRILDGVEDARPRNEHGFAACDDGYFFFATPSSSSFLAMSSPWLFVLTFLSMNFTAPSLSM